MSILLVFAAGLAIYLLIAEVALVEENEEIPDVDFGTLEAEVEAL